MRNPETMQTMRIYVFGILPGHNPFALPEGGRDVGVLSSPEDILYDRKGLKEYGPIERLFRKQGMVETELDAHRVVIRGLFTMGSTISSGGHMIAQRGGLLPHLAAGAAQHDQRRLVRLRPGADAARVAEPCAPPSPTTSRSGPSTGLSRRKSGIGANAPPSRSSSSARCSWR